MIALCYHHLLSEVYVLQTFMMKNISPEPSATIGEYLQRFVSAKDYTPCCWDFQTSMQSSTVQVSRLIHRVGLSKSG